MKYITLVFFALVLVLKSNAQDPRWSHLPNYDDKVLHYGFTIGLNSSGFKGQVSSSYLSDTLKGVSTKFTPGFSLGLILNLRIHEHFDLRFLPTIGFYSRTVNYDFKTSTNAQTIESTFMEFPLLLKYKSQRRKNTRMYMITGLKPSLEAGAKKNQRKTSDLRTSGFDVCLEYGFGFDLYFELFKFSPEIRFSQGLMNLLVDDPNIYSQSLTRLSSQTISIYLNFE
ncbi:MAG: PorT family protein [Cytophagales bacterium]|nr:PorT family protein [Cytophaga sp.]